MKNFLSALAEAIKTKALYPFLNYVEKLPNVVSLFIFGLLGIVTGFLLVGLVAGLVYLIPWVLPFAVIAVIVLLMGWFIKIVLGYE